MKYLLQTGENSRYIFCGYSKKHKDLITLVNIDKDKPILNKSEISRQTLQT